MEKLSIENIVNVPSAMFDNLHKLQVLRCSGCSSVTDEVIMQVIDNCHNLSWLDLRESGVTIKTLAHAKNRKFGFKILDITVHESIERFDKTVKWVTLPNNWLLEYSKFCY